MTAYSLFLSIFAFLQAVALQWSEYVRSDEDHFISSVVWLKSDSKPGVVNR